MTGSIFEIHYLEKEKTGKIERERVRCVGNGEL
jgi:hypothetical protein